MTETEQAAAILAALNDALAPAVAYELSKVPGASGNAGTEPAKYAVVSIARRYTDSRRGSGEVSLNGYRLTVRYIAKSIGDARTMRARGTAALEDQIIVADAGEIGPFVFESSDAFRPDEGYQVGDDAFTF